MYFEGPEKKFELLLAPEEASFLDYQPAFWTKLVEASGAEILSSIQNNHCRAFLLSESSLFVFDHRVVMITCGQTQLVHSLLLLLDAVSTENILSLIFERKNEIYPHLQPSTFEADVARLQQLLPGKTTHFGQKCSTDSAESHFVAMFHLDKDFSPCLEDTTLEILMHDIHPDVLRQLQSADSISTPRANLGSLQELLSGFILDQHTFEPLGYSMNAIRGSQYYTIHITPEPDGSYASFEANGYYEKDDIQDVSERLLAFFRPKRFDIVAFQEGIDYSFLLSDYTIQNKQLEQLSCGYQVHYCHFCQD